MDRRDRDSPVPKRRQAQPPARAEAGGLDETVLDLQRTAGNRAVGDLLAGDVGTGPDSPGLRIRDALRARRKPATELSFAVQRATKGAAGAGGVLQRGSRGAAVVNLQQLLGIAADGIFGGGTQAAVIEFQRASGLVADGVVGPMTMAALGGEATPGPADTTPFGEDKFGGEAKGFGSGEAKEFGGSEDKFGGETKQFGEDKFGGEEKLFDDESKF